jgi:tRNA(Leu) C34 or U34 (ribose-2'-O)-methylase TrmL
VRKTAYVFVAFTGTVKQKLADATRPKRPALVFGSEIRGIDPIIVERADLNVRIEQTAKVESLNVPCPPVLVCIGECKNNGYRRRKFCGYKAPQTNSWSLWFLILCHARRCKWLFR